MLPADEQVEHATRTMQLLTDPTRVRIMWVLAQREVSVNTLADIVGAPPTTVSQHLSKLRLAGVVVGRKQGTRVHYRSTNVHIRQLLEEALFASDHQLQDLPDHGTTRLSPQTAKRTYEADLARPRVEGGEIATGS